MSTPPDNAYYYYIMVGATDAPDAYSVKFAQLRRNLVRALGSETVDVVLQRGVREIAQAYPGFRLTPTDDDGLELTWHPDSPAENSDDLVRAAYSALYAVMLVILARILGREIAVRLAAAVDAERVLQGHSID